MGREIATRQTIADTLGSCDLMTPGELKKLYGEEYPAAVTMGKVRMPLSEEGRFTRHYQCDDPNMGTAVSRFMDGSAKITADELKNEWPLWSYRERLDFCQSCSWLSGQEDFPEILRFVMRHGGEDDWSAIALSVAGALPQSEAFDLLLRALDFAKDRPACNLGQAIASTRHPEAPAALRSLLEKLWKSPDLWEDDDFLNWTAYDATTCIEHLIQIGAPADEFDAMVRELAHHSCEGNRDSCRRFLAKHFPGLD